MSDEQKMNDLTDTSEDNAKAKVERSIVEEFKVDGEAIVSKVKDIIRAGNVRRITVKNEEGKTVFEIPLAAGVAVLFPPVATLVALGAVGALIANLSIAVERKVPADESTITVDETAKEEDGLG